MRVGLIDDHEVVSIAVGAAVDQLAGAEFAGAAATVDELLAQAAPLDVVILDLRLADGSVTASWSGTRACRMKETAQDLRRVPAFGT